MAKSTTTAHGRKTERVVHTEASLFRRITVYENDGERSIRFSKDDAPRQSCMSLKDPGYLVLNYVKLMLASLYLQPDPGRILIIGLGGGTLPTTLATLFPKAQIDTVEIDPAVVRVAREYFGFQVSERVTVAEEDGRAFVRRAARQGTQYDLVMLDAFEQDYIPEHLQTREFLLEVKSVLAPEGVLVSNTWGSSRLYARESATYESVFGRFFSLRNINRVIIAARDGLPPRNVLKDNALILEKRLRRHGVWSHQLLPLFSMTRDWRPGARVLTDRA